MRIEVESTGKIGTLNGMPTRIWVGKTERGIPIHCFITRIAVRRDADLAQFEADLKEPRRQKRRLIRWKPFY